MNNELTPNKNGDDRLTGKPSFARASEAFEVTDLGRTTVADDVVTTIAYLAATQVPGVHRLGTTGVKGALDRMSRTGGVASEVGQRQAAITLDLVIEYGYRLNDVARDVRQRVIEAVEHMADREVVAVDINVVDIHITKQTQTHSRALE